MSEGLALSATPAFAAMALLSGLSGPPAVLCGVASPLVGMVPMYLLMSVFHSSPWVRLISAARHRPA